MGLFINLINLHEIRDLVFFSDAINGFYCMDCFRIYKTKTINWKYQVKLLTELEGHYMQRPRFLFKKASLTEQLIHKMSCQH